MGILDYRATRETHARVPLWRHRLWGAAAATAVASIIAGAFIAADISAGEPAFELMGAFFVSVVYAGAVAASLAFSFGLALSWLLDKAVPAHAFRLSAYAVLGGVLGGNVAASFEPEWAVFAALAGIIAALAGASVHEQLSRLR
jgi:hypothetical protein